MKKLTSNEIRSLWVEYFKSKGHYFLPSKSLIPINDPSLLWINSGVATLKKYFSGEETPISNRLVNSQKAIRTNDIENIGITSRHHTFFEMLGNFSIGDYFKKEAIDFAYDLLINHFQIDKQLLFFTVFDQDQTTYDLWINKGIDKSHIFKCNRDRNFWDIGQGPCGPCTEIFYDRGSRYDFENLGIKLLEKDLPNDRYIEIWNIVFSEFNNDGKNNYTELARKNIDTGAGLERLACVSQAVPTNFDTDLFLPVINEIEKLTSFKYKVEAYFSKDAKQLEINKNFKIIADHFRACVFAIADGAIPSAKDRGSIIRRLFRRSMICLKNLNILQNFVRSIVTRIIEIMNDFYSYLSIHQEKIISILENECESFTKTLNIGYELFNKAINTNSLDAPTIFKLVDTYGFPFELIQDLAKEKNIEINYESYQKKMIEHQNISRKKTNEVGMSQQNVDLLNFKKTSVFSYDDLKTTSTIVGLFNENFQQVEALTKKGWVVFDKTCFYATSGGQQHDEGVITIRNKRMNVLDVIKSPNLQHLHLIYPNDLTINIGDNANLQVDEKSRKMLCANHTTEHLLQHALQTRIDSNIKQKGAYKSLTKLTFDFEYTNKLTNEQFTLIENEINNYIKQNKQVTTKIMTLEQAKKEGALAYFEDVYVKLDNKLRVVNVDGISKEICGGTHVKSTSDIEQFMITSIENKGKNMWRIEAITSREQINNFLISHIENIKSEISKMFNEEPELINQFNNIDYSLTSTNYRRLLLFLNEIKAKRDEIKHNKFKAEIAKQVIQIKQTQPKTYEDKHINVIALENYSNDAIKLALTELSNENQRYGYLILNKINNKTQYFMIVNNQLFKEFGLSAKDIIQNINKQVKGNGGGTSGFAQGATNESFDYDKLVI